MDILPHILQLEDICNVSNRNSLLLILLILQFPYHIFLTLFAYLAAQRDKVFFFPLLFLNHFFSNSLVFLCPALSYTKTFSASK